jgi:hypothetical protein
LHRCKMKFHRCKISRRKLQIFCISLNNKFINMYHIKNQEL